MGYRAYAVMAAFLGVSLLDGSGIHEAAAREVAQFGESGFFRIDYQLQARGGARDQSADPRRGGNTYDEYVRRNRLSFIGAANDTFGAVVQLELNGGQRLGDLTVSDQRRKFEL